MRYDNWDAIVFPRDSHIPIQEFKTACYVANDEYGRHLPTLTCYIASLPASAPFRISMHSWSTKVRPSAIIESRRKPNQRVVYTISVLVDGSRVFHDYYEVSARWPQEIMHEKRSLTRHREQSSQPRGPLEFPPFRQNFLMQSSWDARDNNGRIRVLLSEQLVGRSNNPLTEQDFGASNDIVCFLFQHAPRDILEQAGISWPIRNPLYLPSFLDSRTSAPHIPQSYNTSPDELFFGTGVHSPGLKQFKSPFNRPINPEPGNRPNTAPIPNAAQFPRPPLHERGRRGPPIWDDSLADSFTDSLEDVSVTDTCTWTTHTGLSKSAGDTYIPEMLETSPREVPRETLHNQRNDYDHRKRAKWLESMRGPGEEARHGVTFREDQFGRLVEAFSPPKPNRHSEQTNSHHDHGHAPSMLGPSQGYPKMGTMGAPQNTRPSAASLARTSSYSNFNNGHLRNISHNIARNPEEKKHSKDMDRSPSLAVASAKGKENRNPSENRIPTPFNLGGFTNPHHVFAQGPNPWGPSGRGTVWTTDLEARDQFASMPPQPPVARHSPAPAHVPSGRGGIKSRKEGLGVGSPASCINEQVATTRHDKSLLPAVDTQPLKEPSGDSQKHPPSHAPAPIIPIPEEDAHGRHQHPQPFIPGHRGGMSSMERVETELFSALGEELNSFSQDMGTAATHMSGDANVNVLPSLDELECSPVIKRKRRGSMGGERESPRAKVLRESEDGGCDGPENRGMHHTNENENGNGNGNGIRGTQVQLRGD